MRHLLSGLLMIASVTLATDAGAATPSYSQQRFIARGSDALRAGPPVRNDSDSVRQPYPPRFYQDESRGIQGRPFRDDLCDEVRLIPAVWVDRPPESGDAGARVATVRDLLVNVGSLLRFQRSGDLRSFRHRAD